MNVHLVTWLQVKKAVHQCADAVRRMQLVATPTLLAQTGGLAVGLASVMKVSMVLALTARKWMHATSIMVVALRVPNAYRLPLECASVNAPLDILQSTLANHASHKTLAKRRMAGATSTPCVTVPHPMPVPALATLGTLVTE